MRRPDSSRMAAAARTATAVADGREASRTDLAAATRATLAWLATEHRGRLVEVRVPPFAAVQIGVPGQASAHTRGTPPNVVETDAPTWLALATGALGWVEAVASRRVSASGVHADITAQLTDLVREVSGLSGDGPPGR